LLLQKGTSSLTAYTSSTGVINADYIATNTSNVSQLGSNVDVSASTNWLVNAGTDVDADLDFALSATGQIAVDALVASGWTDFLGWAGFVAEVPLWLVGDKAILDIKYCQAGTLVQVDVDYEAQEMFRGIVAPELWGDYNGTPTYDLLSPDEVINSSTTTDSVSILGATDAWFIVETTLYTLSTYTFSSVDGFDPNGDGGADTELHLFDANGDLVATNDDGDISTLAEIWNFSPLATSTYYIVHSGYNNHVGSGQGTWLRITVS